MKLRLTSKSVIAAALGLAFAAVAAHAQLMVNVSERVTFGAFVGGTNNSVTNNGVINATEVVSTGTPAATPFTVTYNPLLGPSNVLLNTGTLNVGTFTFSSPQVPQGTFNSVPFTFDFDFDNNGIWDLTQNYTLSTSVFTSPNGLTGINYSIVPNQVFGNVSIDGTTYGYASVVSNSNGTLFDGSSTLSAIQFQFLATPVPEPTTYAMAGVMALGGIVALRRRKQRLAAA